MEHLHGDRADLPGMADAFARLAPEIVVDICPLTERDARAVVDTFVGVVRRLVALSSSDVYRSEDASQIQIG